MLIDSVTGVGIFEVHGEETKTALDALRSTYLTMSVSELIERMQITLIDGDKAYYLYGLGLISEEKDKNTVVQILKKHEESLSIVVKLAAILSMGYTGWEDFLEFLDREFEESDNHQVRETIDIARKLIDLKLERQKNDKSM